MSSINIKKRDIAFVTTCKGRLHHIKRTLPLLVAESPASIVVVDYGCPDNVGDWVTENYPDVVVVRIEDDPGFCVARARNLGAKRVDAPWICFIDADVQVKSGWLDWMVCNLDSRFFYRADFEDGVRDQETWGTFLCPREAFESAEGYDEVYRGWGGEDDDLYCRLVFLGLAESYYPAKYVEAITHDDVERLTYYAEKDRKMHYCINSLYREAKLQIMMVQSRRYNPPLEVRQGIMNKITESFLKWKKSNSQELPSITFTTHGTGNMSKPYRMNKRLTFTLSMQEVADTGLQRS